MDSDLKAEGETLSALLQYVEERDQAVAEYLARSEELDARSSAELDALEPKLVAFEQATDQEVSRHELRKIRDLF